MFAEATIEPINSPRFGHCARVPSEWEDILLASSAMPYWSYAPRTLDEGGFLGLLCPKALPVRCFLHLTVQSLFSAMERGGSFTDFISYLPPNHPPTLPPAPCSLNTLYTPIYCSSDWSTAPPHDLADLRSMSLSPRGLIWSPPLKL